MAGDDDDDVFMRALLPRDLRETPRSKSDLVQMQPFPGPQNKANSGSLLVSALKMIPQKNHKKIALIKVNLTPPLF